MTPKDRLPDLEPPDDRWTSDALWADVTMLTQEDVASRPNPIDHTAVYLSVAGVEQGGQWSREPLSGRFSDRR